MSHVKAISTAPQTLQNRWIASCSCGWSKKRLPSPDDATYWWNRHYEDATADRRVTA